MTPKMILVLKCLFSAFFQAQTLSRIWFGNELGFPYCVHSGLNGPCCKGPSNHQADCDREACSKEISTNNWRTLSLKATHYSRVETLGTSVVTVMKFLSATDEFR